MWGGRYSKFVPPNHGLIRKLSFTTTDPIRLSFSCGYNNSFLEKFWVQVFSCFTVTTAVRSFLTGMRCSMRSCRLREWVPELTCSTSL